jgi:type I restriction enzyme S subunit
MREVQQKKIPKLRFPNFMGEWEEKWLGDVSKFFDGKRVPLKSSDRQKRSGNIPYYGASGIIDYIDDYIFDGEYILLAEDGANIVTRSTEIAFLVNGRFWVNNHAHVLQANGSNYFLAEYLESLRYEKYNTGTAQPKLNAQVVKKIQINIPQPEEQQKIADFLGSVDEWAENLKKQKENLEAYKKGMMQKIFSQEIRFKDDNGKAFPDWQEKKFREVTRIVVGGTPKTGVKEYWGGDVGWISSGDLRNGKVNTPSKYITSLGLEKSATELMPENTILLAMTGATLGKIGFLTFPCAGNQSVAGFIPSKKLEARFLFYTMFTIQNQIFALAGGGAQSGINKTAMGSLMIKVPTLEEQQKIADFLTSLDKLIESKNQQIASAQQWKKGLMQKMFV